MDVNWEGGVSYSGIHPKRGAGMQHREARPPDAFLCHVPLLEGAMPSCARCVI